MFAHTSPFPRLNGRGLSLSVLAPSSKKARGVKRRQARRRNAASMARRRGDRPDSGSPKPAGSRLPPSGRLLMQEPWETGASRRASRRFTAAFIVIRVRASGAEDRRRGGRQKPCSAPPRTWSPGECRPRLETTAVAGRWVSPVPSDAAGRPTAPVPIARLAMLLAQRSPPALWRTMGPKGRLSRRRPGVSAGKAAAQRNRPSAPSSTPPEDASRGQKVGQG
jgi:hypothetical protein